MRKILLLIVPLFFLMCHRNTQVEKIILNEVIVEYIKTHEERFLEIEAFLKEIDSTCKTPLVVRVQQDDNYRGLNIFHIFHTHGILATDKTTKLIKKGDRYIAIYAKNKEPLIPSDIPTFLLENCERSIVAEESWIVGLCPNTKNYKAVRIIEGIPIESIVQLRGINCEEKNNFSFPTIQVEDAIIDLEKILPPPFK